MSIRLTVLATFALTSAAVAQPTEKPDDPNRRVATVLGEDILLKSVTPATVPKSPADLLRYRADLLRFRITSPILKDYERGKTIEPTDEELDEMITKIVEEHAGHIRDATEEEQRKFALRVFWMKGVSKDWRRARALHAEHGGRVGISSFGACTAIDAQVVVLKEYAAAGKLTFHDRDLERAFWEHMRGAPNTDVVLRPERVKQHFAKPPWERFRDQLIVEAHEAKQP